MTDKKEIIPLEESTDVVSTRHKKFADLFLIYLNGTRAYMEVYPNASRETAGANSSYLLKDTKIKTYIDAELAVHHASLNEILEILSAQARGDFADFFNVDGSLKSLDELQEKGLSRLIKKMKIRTFVTKQGQEITEHEIELEDRQNAVDKLLKVGGAYKDTLNVNVRTYEIDMIDEAIDVEAIDVEEE